MSVRSKKYPRTYHLPFSPGKSSDDKSLDSFEHFLKREIIVTEKLDGSNLCLTRDSIYGRSHSSEPIHKSFDAAKALHARVRFMIPEGYSIFGEWCYAVHSIKYEEIADPFHVFAIRNDKTQEFSSFNNVISFCKLMSFTHVPELGRYILNDGNVFRKTIENIANSPSTYGPVKEGLVIFHAENFHMKDFKHKVAKWVRKDHIQTSEHWKFQPIEKQNIKKQR